MLQPIYHAREPLGFHRSGGYFQAGRAMGSWSAQQVDLLFEKEAILNAVQIGLKPCEAMLTLLVLR